MADTHRTATLVRAVAAGASGSLPDHALLARFVTDRDEAAFAALVERHGAVVLDAALAVLGHTQDAEDVFQATFLVLARQAATVRKGGSVGCWLHGVARRIALKALRARARRRRHEAAVPPARPHPPGDELTWSEVRGLIHEELARLPESLRAPVILCHLEGLTQDEAAARLDLPQGTLRSRLERGRSILRRRLARHGLALAAAAFPVSLARAVPALLVINTARSATLFAAGTELTTPAAILAHGAIPSMTPTLLKLSGLLLAVVLGAVGWAAAPGDERPVHSAAQTGEGPPASSSAPPGPEPKAAARPPAGDADFEQATFTIKPFKPSWLNPRTRPVGSLKITSNGECLYEVAGAPGNGPPQAWPPARIIHKVSPDQIRRLSGLLKGTNWLTKATPKGPPALHSSEYRLTLKRDGKTTTITVEGDPETYKALLDFFHTLALQEYLLYRLTWAEEAMFEARQELDRYVRAELGEPQEKSPYAIDFTRYVPWAQRLVRNPFNRPADDVATAVRLVGLLKLESEREYLADLATDRDSTVRLAVVSALSRLGGEKSVPVLRKMLRSTNEAAWELIKLGPIAVPTIAEVIRNGDDPENPDYEWLIRAYIDHWKEVSKPLDPKVLDAVRNSLAAPRVKSFRTTYHKELLKLVSEKAPNE